MRKWFIRILWILLVMALLAVAVVFWLIAKGSIGYMPPIEDLQNPISKYATQVYSADGKLLGTWSMTRQDEDGRDRVGVTAEYEELSPYLVQALVATEDERFYEHSGIDFYAVGRAIVKRGLLRQHAGGGGSTITQQLAKQLYSGIPKSSTERLFQKPIEWVIAVQLERYYTKEEIIAMYFNYFKYPYNAVGIKTAAETFFSKTPQELTITEAATLVGMFKAASKYNPKKYPEQSRARRNVVLGQMLKAGYITQAEHDSCCQEPLTLRFHVVDHKDGEGTYFRTFLSKYMMARKPARSDYPSWNYVKYVMDSIAWQEDPLYGWCNKNTKHDGTPYNIYNDGLKVYTTIDSRMQQYAEAACREHVVDYLQPEFNKSVRNKKNAPYPNSLTAKEVQGIMRRNIRQSERYRVMKLDGASDSEIEQAFSTPVPMTLFTYAGEVDTVMSPRDSILYCKSFLRTGFFSMEPQTGHVKAYVGGLDLTHFAYDMATQGRRQVGSTIKPFLYSLAMANNWTPCDEVLNDQRTDDHGNPWPRNGSNARRGEMVSLKWGLQQSNNWVSAALIDTLKPENFVDLLHQYGLRSPDIQPFRALCLGACEITVAEMVSAYTTFVNHGLRAAPMYVTRIVDNDGRVYDFTPRLNMVLPPEAADKMLYMLQAVVDGGTGSRLRFRYNLTAPIGGKTGTTNDNSDGWFMGVTPHLVSGCWVGGEDPDIHFDSMTFGQGASAALPIFAIYMRSLYNDPQLSLYSQGTPFELPSGFDPCYTEDLDSEEEGSEQ